MRELRVRGTSVHSGLGPRKLLVFAPNRLLDDRLGVRVPVSRPAAIADADGDFGAAKDVALVGPLPECDLLLLSGDLAVPAKIAALRVVWLGHVPRRS